MQAAVETFESRENVRVWIGTYNVNGKRERALPLSQWLGMGWDQTAAPDIFVISLQEMIDLSATNVMKEAVTDSLSRSACDEWIAEIGRALEYLGAARPGILAQPVLVAREQMCGIATISFATSERGQQSIRDVATMRAATGAAGGRLGNKGACALRWRMHQSSMCFVGAHLSAHRNDVESRNADYHAIVERRAFKTKRQGQVNAEEYFGVLDHDVVVFFGDLNYRIAQFVGDKEVHYLLKSDLSKLFSLDQLNAERSAKRAFSHGFVEAAIDFEPTYKYLAGTLVYDYEATTESSGSTKKTRCPAWCDRILYRVAPQGPRHPNPIYSERVRCAVYGRADDRLRISDHRPVHAVLDITTRKVDVEKRALALASVAKQAPTRTVYDSFFATRASSAPPGFSCALEPGAIWLKAAVECTVSLKATPLLPERKSQKFAFAHIPEWLRIEPSSGVLEENTVIRASANLENQKFLADLAQHGGLLGATLLLHCGVSAFAVPACLTSSPDWFTPLVVKPVMSKTTTKSSFSSLKSSFSSSSDDLSKLKGPMPPPIPRNRPDAVARSNGD